MTDRLQTDLQRRVLAHLPRYRTDEQHIEAQADMREAHNLPDDWEFERSLTPTALCNRLDDDELTPIGIGDEEAVLEVLVELQALGFAGRAIDGRWATTEAGYGALHTLSESEQEAHEARLASMQVEVAQVGSN